MRFRAECVVYHFDTLREWRWRWRQSVTYITIAGFSIRNHVIAGFSFTDVLSVVTRIYLSWNCKIMVYYKWGVGNNLYLGWFFFPQLQFSPRGFCCFHWVFFFLAEHAAPKSPLCISMLLLLFPIRPSLLLVGLWMLLLEGTRFYRADPVLLVGPRILYLGLLFLQKKKMSMSDISRRIIQNAARALRVPHDVLWSTNHQR